MQCAVPTLDEAVETYGCRIGMPTAIQRLVESCGTWMVGSVWLGVPDAVEIDPTVRANVDRLAAKVGERAFRRGVARMTRCDLDA